MDYWAYRLSSRIFGFDEKVLSYNPKLVKKAMFYMKAHFSDLSDPVPIIRFTTTFKLACDTINILEKVTM